MSPTFQLIERALRVLLDDVRKGHGFQVKHIRDFRLALAQLNSWDNVDKRTILEFQDLLVDAEMNRNMLSRLERVLCDPNLRLENLIRYAHHGDGVSLGIALSEAHLVFND